MVSVLDKHNANTKGGAQTRKEAESPLNRQTNKQAYLLQANSHKEESSTQMNT